MAMIPWWIHYPNVNNEIINLDWILDISNENTDKIENFIGVNTIKYADPILWDITSQYEANTIVVDPQTGDAYISTKAVPYGVALSNDGYWTKIYNYASEIHTFREQIAADEQLSTTATAPRSIDDLVFLNGLLYRVTAPMIAGDSYVEGSNCVKTTINAELLRLHTSINSLGGRIDDEAEARADVDIALGGRIDDEAEARADADTALGGRIDDEAEARADADTTLGERITALGEKVNTLESVGNLVMFGDSYAEQTNGWCDAIINYIDYSQSFKFALSGIGFARSGYSTFHDMLDEALSSMTEDQRNKTSIVIIGGGINDQWDNTSDLQSACNIFFRDVKAAFPNASIYWFANWGAMAIPFNYVYTTIDAIVQQAMKYEVVCITDLIYILLGAGSFFMQSDNVHPTSVGYDLIAKSLVAKMKGQNYDYLAHTETSTGITLLRCERKGSTIIVNGKLTPSDASDYVNGLNLGAIPIGFTDTTKQITQKTLYDSYGNFIGQIHVYSGGNAVLYEVTATPTANTSYFDLSINLNGIADL